MSKSYNLAQKSVVNHIKQPLDQFYTIADSKAVCNSTQSSFFDISYIFSDPFAHKKSKKYSKQIKLTAQKTAVKSSHIASSQNRYLRQRKQSPMQNSGFMQIDQTVPKDTLNSQKTYLLFDKNSANQAIHSKRKTALNSIVFRNVKLLRDSQRQSQKNTILGDGILTGKGYNNTIDLLIYNKQKRPHQKSQKSTRMSLHRDRQLRYAQRNETPRRYSKREIDWAKTTMVMRNRQSLRVYRPWSPVHIDKDQNIYDQNNFFG